MWPLATTFREIGMKKIIWRIYNREHRLQNGDYCDQDSICRNMYLSSIKSIQQQYL